MNKAILRIVGIALVLSPVIGVAQNRKPTDATYITKEEVDKVNATPGVDRTLRVVDIGDQHFSVGIRHRGKKPRRPRRMFPETPRCYWRADIVAPGDAVVRETHVGQLARGTARKSLW